MPAPSPASTPQNRAERSRRTRERLLDATITSLVEVGYARTSMQELCTRAQVSRGAQLHHYPTKAKLMAAAIEHLYAQQQAAVGELADEFSGDDDSVGAVVAMISRGFSGPRAQASIELWTAARTDPELLASLEPIERELAHSTQEHARGLLGPELDQERFEELFWLTVSVVRGLALDEMLKGSRRRRDGLLAAWRALSASSYATTDQGGYSGASSSRG